MFMITALSSAAWPIFPGQANVPKSYGWDLMPPMAPRQAFVTWMREWRGEDPEFTGNRWDRFQVLVDNRDLINQWNKRAFLMTPREEFVLRQHRYRAYEHTFLDIGFGVTISGPHLVARMTSALDVQLGDIVLEIGTGSGYQSAYLANLTNNVWTIEIVKGLAERTRRVYDSLIEAGYTEYKAINTKQGDGYYGWEDSAPFDKIIVTCGVDHIPPPLLQQLRPGGIMVIPVGPPGAQHVLKIIKEEAADGSLHVARSDIYGGMTVPFVPLTKLEGEKIAGTHNR
jgi:protein-L-isoaspartate(D-aspartate) O-methyltransferase